MILVRHISRLEKGPNKRLPRSSIAYQPSLNSSQVGVKFINEMGICHWSLLPQSPEETLYIGKSGASTPSALRFLNYDVVKKTSLCWALYPRHMHDQSKL